MSVYRLSEVLRNLVLDDPHVRELISAAKPDERLQAMLHRRWYTPVCRYWPTIADEDLQRTASGDSPIGILACPTPEVAAALKAIADRYGAVVATLRSRLAVARGQPITGQSEVISPGIWSDRRFRIDFVNGDVGEFTKLPKNRVAPPFFEVKWAAVTIEATSNLWSGEPAAQELRKKKKPALSRVEKAVKALWPEGNMDGLSAKERNTQIKDWLHRNALRRVGERTIQRYFDPTRH